MFSISLGRAVRTVCSAPSPCSAVTRSPAVTFITLAKPPQGHQRQRRNSSSKASSAPPDGSKRSTPSQQATSGSGRLGRRKTKEAVVPLDSMNLPFSKQYPNLPSVPSTQHVHPSDINVSSFFSLHRPISVTLPVPVTSSEQAFSSIFESRQPSRKKFDDVIYTLSSVVEDLEPIVEGEEHGVQWQVLHGTTDGEVKHLDGPPRNLSVDKILSQFRPFRPPPVPQPFNESESTTSVRKQKKARAKTSRSKRKSWSTTIIVTEYTTPDGQKTYAAASTPIVRVPVPGASPMIDPEVTPRPSIRQPFLKRMQIRQQRLEDYRHVRYERSQQPVMRLISVKRQRKMKMKKHKYKKLMKRTRNLRRRLGKL
ncbi:hypothetical protein EJ06DRAFT_532763 [Trichodelitschia bisporula]|uniref:Small ribosomal subunit protein mS38 n=1 Tax=Trichodelitschia bisporula TaxID=703511 RepID=A0A6G1HPJ0_9PEZI|nr:hypothetical protein EJ06DRAFT_532763 [Trichodelitschia bisporula]